MYITKYINKIMKFIKMCKIWEKCLKEWNINLWNKKQETFHTTDL